MFELSGVNYEEVLEQGDSILVRVIASSSYRGFELSGLYCNTLHITYYILYIIYYILYITYNTCIYVKKKYFFVLIFFTVRELRLSRLQSRQALRFDKQGLTVT